VEFFREHFGPTKTAVAQLDPAGQAAYAQDQENLWSAHNEGGDGRSLVRAEYLEVIAVRA
jgi:hypothetical protein